LRGEGSRPERAQRSERGLDPGDPGFEHLRARGMARPIVPQKAWRPNPVAL
jgi:hypothetical protein